MNAVNQPQNNNNNTKNLEIIRDVIAELRFLAKTQELICIESSDADHMCNRLNQISAELDGVYANLKPAKSQPH